MVSIYCLFKQYNKLGLITDIQKLFSKTDEEKEVGGILADLSGIPDIKQPKSNPKGKGKKNLKRKDFNLESQRELGINGDIGNTRTRLREAKPGAVVNQNILRKYNKKGELVDGGVTLIIEPSSKVRKPRRRT